MCNGPSTQDEWHGDGLCAPPNSNTAEMAPTYHPPRVDEPLYCQTLFVNIKIDTGFLYVYFFLYICLLFNEFPRFSWSGDVGLLTSDYCFIYVLHCPYLSQSRIWNYRCIALGIITIDNLKLRLYCAMCLSCRCLLTFLHIGVPVRLYVKHSTDCAVASHSRWCLSCCFFSITLHSAAFPCCVFFSITSQLLHLRISFRNLKQNFKSTICIPPPIFFV